MPFDYKKEYKEFYLPPKTPGIVTVPAMDFLAVGVFQAAGKGNLALFMAICRKVILEIPFMFLFDRLWPMYGLGFSQFAAEFIMTIIGTVLLVRFLHQTERSVHDQTA